MSEKRILGLYINHKFKDANKLQSILIKYGCIIRTRLGINADEDVSDKGSIIILELLGSYDDICNLEKELLNLKGMQIDRMIFSM